MVESLIFEVVILTFPDYSVSFTSLYSVRMPENTDQKNSEYRHFSHSGYHIRHNK